MSRSEDYLDQLLKGVSPEDKKEAEQEVLEENIFNDILEEFAEESTTDEAEEAEDISFEIDDLFGDVDFTDDDGLEDDFLEEDFLDDDFLREFEKEMGMLEQDSTEEEIEEAAEEIEEPSHLDDLDSILSGAKEQMEAVVDEEPSVAEESNAALEAFLEATAEPMADEEPVVEEEPTTGGEFSFADLFADDSASDEADAAPQEDADVLKILQGLEGVDLELDEEDNAGEQQDFSALEGFLAASAADDTAESSANASGMDIESFAFEEPEEAAQQEKKAKKEKKEKKASDKEGFMNKLGFILFGEDDEEEEEPEKKKKDKKLPFGRKAQDEAADSENPKKEKKKREKKEKVKKEKAPKPKKEKKPKKPKEPDNTPPLPKKPVFLIFLMVGSLLALILMGADLLGYSNQMTEAKNQYAKKNYSEAFAEISGMEIKKEDLALYEKYHIMAMVSVELEAYESLMEQEFYDMALDCLVRTIGRAEKYRADAQNYGCIQELNALELEAEEILSETFDVSREEALEFYAYRNKKEYSTAIKNVIKELGLEKVTEE